ncbi:carboxypeptidase-like regulatory domain-containing protein [Hymenobacter koreensis]|uniref:Carboxypeptidase-like regulatory domain-containing protein n=1 Tax=Hymenobacter koreensis TaxID=1084523 RepID=A0ABP8JAA7_9BACT
MKVDYETTESDEQLHSEEDSLDSGNRKLAIIAVLVLLIGGLAFVFVPASNRQRIANGQMPNFELMGASVVGTREVEEAPKPAVEEVAAAPADAPEKNKPALAVKKPVQREEIDALEPTTASLPAVVATPEPVQEAAAPAVEEAPRMVTLSGRVLNEVGRPLAGATVFVKGSRRGTGTDGNGNYTLEVPAGENTLVYGYGGYQDQEMRARGGQPISVTLVPSDDARRGRRR